MRYLLFFVLFALSNVVYAQTVLNTSLTVPETHIIYIHQTNILQVTGFGNTSDLSLVSSRGDTLYPSEDSLFYYYPDFQSRHDSLKIYSNHVYLKTVVFDVEALDGLKLRFGDLKQSLTDLHAGTGATVLLVHKQALLENPGLVPTHEPQLFKAAWHILGVQVVVVKKNGTRIPLHMKTESPGKFSEEDLEVIHNMEPGETIWYGNVQATCAGCMVNGFYLNLRLILTENQTPTATISLQDVLNSSLAFPKEPVVYRDYDNVLQIKKLSEDSSTVIIGSDGTMLHLKDQALIYSPSTKGISDSLIIFHHGKYVNSLVFDVESLGTPTTYFGQIQSDTTISMEALLDNPGFSSRYDGTKLKRSNLKILDYRMSVIKSTGEEIYLHKNTFKSSDGWSEKRFKRYNARRLKRGMDVIKFSRKQLRQMEVGDIILFDPTEAKMPEARDGRSHDPESLVLRIK